MQDTLNELAKLESQVKEALLKLNEKNILTEIEQLNIIASAPGFWDDQKQAQSTNSQLSRLNAKIKPWLELKKQVCDNLELAKTGDESLALEINNQLGELKTVYDSLKKELLFNDKFDNYNVILSIYAGAGGTDAQDWAEMLMRMYLRWTESTPGLKANIIEQSSGEEAGIKSVTLEVNGNLAYGKLKGEQGVHRLVRLSPFNADHLRQTSFAKVDVMPEIEQPSGVVIEDKDIKIDVYRAGGHGGQSVNTTDSAVRVTHLPTGISVAIQNERSQLQNKETAMTILRSKLVSLQIDQHKEKIEELKGPNEQAAWGNQIRNYVQHPYSLVKDLRTKHEASDIQGVLDGKIDDFIMAYLESSVDEPVRA